jgi:hypothetical protein
VIPTQCGIARTYVTAAALDGTCVNSIRRICTAPALISLASHVVCLQFVAGPAWLAVCVWHAAMCIAGRVTHTHAALCLLRAQLKLPYLRICFDFCT